MRYHHLSSPRTATSAAFNAAPSRATTKNSNGVSQPAKREVGDLESYVRRKADASMRRAMRSVWLDTFTDIDDFR